MERAWTPSLEKGLHNHGGFKIIMPGGAKHLDGADYIASVSRGAQMPRAPDAGRLRI